MRKLFNVDNPIMRVLTKIFDLMALSVFWIVFSIPIVTMGAASSALYSAVYRHVRLGEGYLWKSFWEPFKRDFKRSTLAWLPLLGMILFLVFDIITLRYLIKNGHPLGAVYGIMLVLLVVAAVWGVHLAAYCARFKGTVKNSIRYSFYVLMAHPLRAIGIAAALLLSAALILVFPGFAILLPADSIWLVSYLIERSFLQHMSEEDAEKTKAELADHD